MRKNSQFLTQIMNIFTEFWNFFQAKAYQGSRSNGLCSSKRLDTHKYSSFWEIIQKTKSRTIDLLKNQKKRSHKNPQIIWTES
jgi:hypothetical protein